MLPIVLWMAAVMPVQGDEAVRVVSVKFVNQSTDIRAVYVSVPGYSRRYIGSFSRGGTLTARIPVLNANEPLTVRWKAGNHSGQFTIDSDTASYLRIDITHDGSDGPYPIDEPASTYSAPAASPGGPVRV